MLEFPVNIEKKDYGLRKCKSVRVLTWCEKDITAKDNNHDNKWINIKRR